MGQLFRALFSIYFLSWAANSLSSAQESETIITTDTNITARPIEEITVVGQRSLARLRLRINEKENEIFSFFNAQNSSSRMDIVCSKRRPTGTYIMKRECEPRFMKSLRAEMARGMLLGTGIGFSQRDLVEFSARDFEMLQNEMTDLMASSQEFARSLADLADLAENYEAHRKAMFERQ